MNKPVAANSASKTFDLIKRSNKSAWLSVIWDFSWRKPVGGVSLLFLILICAAAVFAPWVANYDPNQIHSGEALTGPNTTYWLGTDHLARDIYSRIIVGARVSLGVGISVMLVASVTGALAGTISAYFGGKTDLAIQRVVDALDAFPTLVLALLIMAVMGQTLVNLVIAVTIVSVPGMTRVVRSAALSVKESLYVQSAQALGASTKRVVFIYILPNCLAPIIVIASASLGVAILVEASLSFIGLGVPPDVPTWGGMLSGQARTYMQQAPWMVIFPGLALTLTVVAINLLGDALRDRLDPRLRGSR